MSTAFNNEYYTVKKLTDLTDSEIKTILASWDVDEWKELNGDEFRSRFEKSEFHFLTDAELKILCVARINFKFKVQIGKDVYQIAELVGFVATEILKGYGKVLLGYLAENLRNRKIEAVGFCRKKNSPFYESSGFKIYYNKVKFLREKRDDRWITPVEDDDIIDLTLTDAVTQLLDEINDENPAYLLFE